MNINEVFEGGMGEVGVGKGEGGNWDSYLKLNFFFK